MSFVVEGEEFNFENTTAFAQIANMSADIHEDIRETNDGRFIQLTVIGDDVEHRGADGVYRGWYVARAITPGDAEKVRKSWAILRPQPGSAYYP